MKTVKDTKIELQETKLNLITSFADQLEKIKATKKEIEAYRERLVADGVNEIDIHKAVKDYPINKRLAFILQEKAIHKNLDDAIEFLDYIAGELIKYDGEDAKGNKNNA